MTKVGEKCDNNSLKNGKNMKNLPKLTYKWRKLLKIVKQIGNWRQNDDRNRKIKESLQNYDVKMMKFNGKGDKVGNWWPKQFKKW